MIQTGTITEVKVVTAGSYLMGDHGGGSTELGLEDASAFNVDGGSIVINGDVYAYVSVNYDDNNITLEGDGLFSAGTDGDAVELYPQVSTKEAVVIVGDSIEGINVRVPFALRDRLPEGMRADGEGEAVEIESQGTSWVLKDVLGKEPVLDGAFIDTATLPTADASDGNEPAYSPTPSVDGGIGSLYVKWTPVLNSDPVEYEVHVGTNPDFIATEATLERVTTGSSAVITVLPGGAALANNTDYHVKIVARDVDGAAEPSPAAAAQARQVTGPDISTNYVYTGALQANQIKGGRIESEITIGGKIKTADVGARVEMDSAGIRLIKSNGDVTTILGTDTESTFRGQVEASNLTTSNGLTIRGLDANGQVTNNELSQGGILRLASKTTASAQAPSVVMDWAATALKDVGNVNLTTTLGSLYLGADNKWLIPITNSPRAVKLNTDGTYSSTVNYSAQALNAVQVGNDYFGFTRSNGIYYLNRLNETVTFTDDFTTNALATNWPATYGDVTVVNGQLVTTSHKNYSGAGRTLSAGIKGKAVSAKAIALVNGASAESYMSVANGTAKAVISVDATGSIVFIGPTGRTTVTYNASTMAFWRIAEVAGSIIFQTSADGAVWNTQATQAHAWSDTTLAGMTWEMGVGAYARINNATNGNFETNLTGWSITTESKAALTRSTDRAYTGTYSAKVVKNSGTTGTIGVTNSNAGPAIGGKYYRVSMKAYTTNARLLTLYGYWGNSTSSWVGDSIGVEYMSVPNQWVEVYAYAQAPTTADKLKVELYADDLVSAETVYFDDIRIEEVDTAVGTNIAVNPSAEVDITGWLNDPTEPATISRSSDVSMQGNYSVKVVATANDSWPYVESPLTPVTPGKEYVGSISVKAASATGTRGADIYLEFYDANGNAIGYFDSISISKDSSSVWTTRTCVGQAPADAAFARMGVSWGINVGMSNGETHYMDNVSISEVGVFSAAFDSAKYTTPAIGIAYPSLDVNNTPALGVKGSNLLVAEANTAYKVSFKEVNPATLAITGTEVVSTTTGFFGPFAGVMYGNFDFGAARYIVARSGTDGFYQTFDATGVNQVSEAFDIPTGGILGFGYDGTKFLSLSTNGQLLSHTTTKWTTATDAWKAGFTWFDGASQETAVSPYATFTMKKRSRLRLTAPVLPSTATAIKAYVGYSTGNAYFQATSTTGTSNVTLSAFASLTSGTVAPTVGTYAALNPASIQSTAGELVIKADGSIGLGAANGSNVRPLTLNGATGTFTIGYASESVFNSDGTAKIKGLQLYSAQDATNTVGNKPALLIGNPALSHLRIDGDEIISMVSDNGTTAVQGALVLNAGGNVSMPGTMKQGTDVVTIAAVNTHTTKRINFSTPFPTSGPLPVVMLTLKTITSSTAAIRISTSGVDYSGFTVQMMRTTGTGDTAFDYLAIATV